MKSPFLTKLQAKKRRDLESSKLTWLLIGMVLGELIVYTLLRVY